MKKFISIIIISLMICNVCILPTAAATPSIVIGGGAVAGGGIASGSNAKGDLAALLASLVLASQGVKVGLSSDSTIQSVDFVKNLLEEYANLVGSTFESLCDLWVNNVRILADGAISMGQESCKSAYKFLSWLKHDGYISSNLGDRDYVLINDVLCPVVHPGDIIDTVNDAGNQTSYENIGKNDFVIFASYWPRGEQLYLVSKDSVIKVREYYRGYPSSTLNFPVTYLNGLYYATRTLSTGIYTYQVPLVDGNAIEAISNLNGSLDNAPTSPDENTLVGDSSIVNPDNFNISDNEVNILSPGLDFSALAIQSGVDGIVQIKEYIDTLIRSVNGIDDNVLKVNDSITGILQELPVDLDIYNSTSVDTDTDSGNGVSIIDDQQYPDAETTQKYIQHMKFNLINVFPFCIPFDIVNLLSKLDVEPVTPNVHLSFPNPVLREPIEFDLDFSQWNGVAQVVRNAELVAFVVGLAMVTRNLIRG